MTTPEEITKLAEEYAEEIYPHEEFEDIGQLDFLRNTTKKNVSAFIRWLLRTHCIVSKEKVREVYDNANHGDAYDRFENGYNLGVVETIKSIFDPDTFDETDK